MDTYLKPDLEVIEFDRNDAVLTSYNGGSTTCCTGKDYVIELPDLPIIEEPYLP